MNIPWWYWVVGGFALMLIELLGPTFFILWFGIAACLVGVVKAFVPLTLAQEFGLWGALSAILVALWFWLFPAPQRTRSGLSKEAVIGERGLITKDVLGDEPRDDPLSETGARFGYLDRDRRCADPERRARPHRRCHRSDAQSRADQLALAG